MEDFQVKKLDGWSSWKKTGLCLNLKELIKKCRLSVQKMDNAHKISICEKVGKVCDYTFMVLDSQR